MKGKRVVAFSGLGDNQSFFSLVKAVGARVIYEIAFPDHHAYRESEMGRIFSHQGIDLYVTTEKDAVKLADLPVPDNLFYLAMEAVIENEEELIDMILNKVKGA
jgi:tetraacyldisaccharide-1-P 4'-kinase